MFIVTNLIWYIGFTRPGPQFSLEPNVIGTCSGCFNTATVADSNLARSNAHVLHLPQAEQALELEILTALGF